MNMLIVFRALQGLGAGGLIVLAQTVIGDLVAPRERGKYQGLFAAVFTTCSVAGPLLGGFITEYASWRWIFYVNLPVGLLALALIGFGLKRRPPGPAPRLDILGAALLTGGTCCLLLMLSWGGNAYAWDSMPILALLAATLAAFIALVLVERRAAQPVIPPDLFDNAVFVLGAAIIALAAMALFAATVFLPLMFQLLMGASPSDAGLLISPMMGGVIVASFSGGRIVSRTGRYKLMPIIGLAVAVLSYLALSFAARHPVGMATIEAILVVMGLGIGFVMPNLTTAIQNAVERAELGAATSTAAFFRSLGGALGVALSGAVLAAQLRHIPSGLLGSSSGVAEISRLPAAQRDLVLHAYRTGLSDAFVVGACIAAAAFVVVLFLPERPLRETRSS
jgi:EmrB/QacA subfamily drug resistance transporter